MHTRPCQTASTRLVGHYYCRADWCVSASRQQQFTRLDGDRSTRNVHVGRVRQHSRGAEHAHLHAPASCGVSRRVLLQQQRDTACSAKAVPQLAASTRQCRQTRLPRHSTRPCALLTTARCPRIQATTGHCSRVHGTATTNHITHCSRYCTTRERSRTKMPTQLTRKHGTYR